MHTIQLPMSLQTRLYGPVLIGISVLLILISPVAWSWRLAAVSLSILWGSWLWRRFLQRRPVALLIGTGGDICCACADDRTLEVSRIFPGLLHPSLIVARLGTGVGEYRDLFVPGDALSPDRHWELRRALIGFRPHQPDSRRGT